MKYLGWHSVDRAEWSLPLRGAWIEIPLSFNILMFLRVAPLAGGVD